MDTATLLYLGGTIGLFAVFVAIVIRTYSRRHKKTMEAAKYRMMEDDD